MIVYAKVTPTCRMKKVRIKARVVQQPCQFRGICPSPCDWCNTHSYSEACVPVFVKLAHDLAKTNARQKDTINALLESRTELSKENALLREKLGIDDVW